MTTPDFADLTPPDELIEQWIDASWGDSDVSPRQYITAQAARWGAQQGYRRGADDARRPAPPSLKQQALSLLDPEQDGQFLGGAEADLLRRALALIPEDSADG